MNIIEKIKLARGLEKDANAIEDGMKTKNATKIIAAVVGALTLVAQNSVVQKAVLDFLTAHPAVSAVVGGVAGILALFHNPKQAAPPAQIGNQ